MGTARLRRCGVSTGHPAGVRERRSIEVPGRIVLAYAVQVEFEAQRSARRVFEELSVGPARSEPR
jgi:hypothetical protein